jgi:hypothetical protein
MKKRNLFIPMVLILFSFTTVVQGQNYQPWEPPTDDPPVAPVDHWLPFLFVTAVLFAFHWFQRQLSKNKIDI